VRHARLGGGGEREAAVRRPLSCISCNISLLLLPPRYPGEHVRLLRGRVRVRGAGGGAKAVGGGRGGGRREVRVRDGPCYPLHVGFVHRIRYFVHRMRA
jgi:hypothetical protein